MTTTSLTADARRRTGTPAQADAWARLVAQIAELEEILQEAAASPDQDAFRERAALTRLLLARRQALRELDVGATFSARATRLPRARPRSGRAAGA